MEYKYNLAHVVAHKMLYVSVLSIHLHDIAAGLHKAFFENSSSP